MDYRWIEIRSQIGWLLAQGDAVIRWRTANDLIDPSDPTREDLNMAGMERALLSSPQVQQWLGHLRQAIDDWRWHHSRPDTIENAMGKLLDFGLRRGIKAFDEAVDPIREWLANPPRDDSMGGYSLSLCQSIASWSLVRAGYHDPAASKYLQMRLDALYDLAHSGRTDIYIDPDTYGNVPQSRRGIPLVDPALYDDPSRGVRLPSIHDLLGLMRWPFQLDTEENQAKRNALLSYLLRPEVQTWRDGFGLMRVGHGHYYSIGWDAKLPGYDGPPYGRRESHQLIHRLLLLADQSAVREHSWFAQVTHHLDTFRTATGWCFSVDLLPARRSGYWVAGGNNALMFGRRTAALREIESTFYRLLILYRSGM